MNVVYHPAVQREVTGILRHYDRVSGVLGDAFWDELMAAVESILKHPDRYRMVVGPLRRKNLARFPYHVLYRVMPDRIRITVVRHHRRDPSFGMDRR